MKYPMRPVTPLVLPRTPENFLIQYKYNGWNIVIDGGCIYSRRGKDLTAWNCWKDVNLDPLFPINGELVALTGKLPDVQGIRTGRVDFKIMAFDVMVERTPIERRLSQLSQERLGLGSKVKICPTLDAAQKHTSWDAVNKLFRYSRSQGYEGLVLKEKGSLYHIGEYGSIASPSWIKLKNMVTVA